MGVINELDEITANQIAAGEVIEKPCNVVKELVENAIDAGSKNIEIHIKNGGLAYIMVQDDGIGMDATDLKICVKRFTTSKLTSFLDLYQNNTFGFRGEALCSIASVAKLEIKSRQQNNDSGYAIKACGNNIGDAFKASCPHGTRVLVKDLFFNVPARIKFLKSNNRESLEIFNLIKAFCVVEKDINFVFFDDEKKKIDTNNYEHFIERAINFLGKETKNNLYFFENMGAKCQVDGYLCSPLITRKDQKGVKIFINDRLVESKPIFYAVKYAYQSLLETGRNPLAIIKIKVPPEQIDINIHPRKAEVKLLFEDEVLRDIRNAITNVLAKTPWFSSDHLQKIISPTLTYTPNIAPSSYVPKFGKREKSFHKNIYEHKAPISLANNFSFLAPPINEKNYKYIGQINNTFLLFASEGGLAIIDQHASHERFLYEKLKAKNDLPALLPNNLLIPQEITVNTAFFDEYEDELVALGFLAQKQDENKLLITAMPKIFASKDLSTFIADLLDELDTNKMGNSAQILQDRFLATLACHTAVRAGQVLNEMEVKEILNSLNTIDFNAQCPHGRPIIKFFAETDIKKWFKRP